MSDKRTVTIGVTVNLGNYESLRLDVSDTAETKSDADELRLFLAEVLDGFGNNNATAKAAIEKYKDKILSDAEIEPEIKTEYEPEPEIIPPVILEQQTEEKTEPDVFENTETETQESLPPLLSEILKTEEPETEEIIEPEPLFSEIETEPEPTPEIIPEPEPEEPKVSVPLSKASEGEFTCDKCGAKISKVQRDVSNLFMGKSLCKNCMK